MLHSKNKMATTFNYMYQQRVRERGKEGNRNGERDKKDVGDIERER